MDTTQAERDQQLVAQWTGWLRAGMKKKRQFAAMAAEVDRFFEQADHRHQFQSEALRRWLDTTSMVAVTVNLAFQIRGWMAPALYHRNPTRTVTSRSVRDTVLRAMSRVVEAYLNYTPNETELLPESRAGIDEGLLAGRGVLFTGYDDETGLITSWSVSVDDVLIDPDARKPEEAQWIAYRRRAPLSAVKAQYKKPAEEIKGDRVSEGADKLDPQDEVKKEGEETDDEAAYGATNDIVTVWEIYSKMGLGWAGRDVPDRFQHFDDSKRFRKIDVVLGHDRPLYVGPWDTKIYLDRAWPFSFLDLTPTRNKLWPVSLMAAAMIHQKVINLAATLWFELVKVSARKIFGVPKGLDRPRKDQITRGGLLEVLELGTEDETRDIKSIVTVFGIDAQSTLVALSDLIAAHESWFAQTTGLMPVIKGAENEAQVRSATEADIKDKNARSRLGDLSERVEDWQTRAARNEGILVRTDLTAKDVDRVVGDAVELGWLVSWKHLGVEVPVRSAKKNLSDEEALNDLSLEAIHPSCAEYFGTEEEALAHADEMFQALPGINAQRTQGRIQAGLVPLSGLFFTDVRGQPTITVRRVTVADVWRDTRWLSNEDVARELSYRVEAGSTKRPDANKMIDIANMLMQNVGAPAIKVGDVGTYNEVLGAVYKALKTPDEMQVLLPLPPPPQPQAPGMEGGEGMPMGEGMPTGGGMGGGMGGGDMAPPGVPEVGAPLQPSIGAVSA